jgi:hypothetical protein
MGMSFFVLQLLSYGATYSIAASEDIVIDQPTPSPKRTYSVAFSPQANNTE